VRCGWCYNNALLLLWNVPHMLSNLERPSGTPVLLKVRGDMLFVED